MKLKVFFLATICLLAGLGYGAKASAATYYVSTTGNDSNAGTSGSPWKTISYATTAVSAGDTVIVMNGTYYENRNNGNEMGLYFQRGGTSVNDEVTFEAMNPGNVIIDGANTVGMGMYVEADHIKIEGFDIRNYRLGGISVYGASVTIAGNNIHDNGGYDSGSDLGQDGIYTASSAGSCTIERNSIFNNGRLSLPKSDSAGGLDHGIYLCGTDSKVRYNLIHGNQAFGIQLAGYTPINNILVENNVIYGQKNKGGIMFWQPGLSDVTVKNNIISQNAEYAIDFYDDGGSGHIINNNDFYNNAYGTIGSAGSGHYSAANNLTLNPLFVSSSDFHLQSASPAINAGTDVGLTSDFAGNPIVGTPDIGAYEYQGSSSTTTAPAAPTGLAVK